MGGRIEGKCEDQELEGPAAYLQANNKPLTQIELAIPLQLSSPSSLLVSKTNKSLDLAMPGRNPEMVAIGNSTTPVFFPKATMAVPDEPLYLHSLLSLAPLINSFKFLAARTACFCAMYPCFSSCKPVNNDTHVR